MRLYCFPAFLLLSVAAEAPIDGIGTCAPNWTYFNGSCYRLFNYTATYYEAETACSSRNAINPKVPVDLASYETADEKEFLVSLSANKRFWIKTLENNSERPLLIKMDYARKHEKKDVTQTTFYFVNSIGEPQQASREAAMQHRNRFICKYAAFNLAKSNTENSEVSESSKRQKRLVFELLSNEEEEANATILTIQKSSTTSKKTPEPSTKRRLITLTEGATTTKKAKGYIPIHPSTDTVPISETEKRRPEIVGQMIYLKLEPMFVLLVLGITLIVVCMCIAVVICFTTPRKRVKKRRRKERYREKQYYSSKQGYDSYKSSSTSSSYLSSRT